MPGAVHYIPIATTCLALAFGVTLWRRYRERGGLHLLWWAGGMLTYAAGTITESVTTLWGWDPVVFRAWYITGALLGGAPLAQGTAYLLLSRRTADRLAIALVLAVVAGAVAVCLSPLNLDLVEPHRLSGRVLAWHQVRLVSPFINTYALILLVGGALLSARRYWRRPETRHRALANAAIALGGLLPGIGGAFTRFGMVEVLYVTEFVGLGLIYAGYRLSVGPATGGLAPAALPQ
jgi:uncharacterized membrane protein